MTTFDTFNPFTTDGAAAPGVLALMFESLLMYSLDEESSAYGLLADDVSVAPDHRSATFRIRRNARFSNGDPVLASDVQYSFRVLASGAFAPAYQEVYADVMAVEAIDARTVRFVFRKSDSELPLWVGTMPVFSPKWLGATPDGRRTLKVPIASGPYVIEQSDGGRNITYKKNKNYWGRGIPFLRGLYNFDQVEYHLYPDRHQLAEAVKVGVVDYNVEYSVGNWLNAYKGDAQQSEKLFMREFPYGSHGYMQGYMFNTRRPIFRDVRVRRALAVAFDFESLNQREYAGKFRRLTSWFANSDLAADPAARKSNGAGSTRLRFSGDDHLKEARQLLADAGWTMQDGLLRNVAGVPFTFEFIDEFATRNPGIKWYAHNLAQLGISVQLNDVDSKVYHSKLDRFDFDMINTAMRTGDDPGRELRDRFGSRAAETRGSNNLSGVASSTADKLIDSVVTADTRSELVSSARSLDRFLMDQTLIVPFGYKDSEWVVYRSGLAFPDVLPRYYRPESWVLETWWRTTNQ
ncbi:extracellular solute-binding protein [Burkholderia sp. Ed8]|uniref:extracellular solute-binding protein n=1 Tax=Burkholderia sp. Ed8 TaxID=3112957 RepID=UPI00345C918A